MNILCFMKPFVFLSKGSTLLILAAAALSVVGLVKLYLENATLISSPCFFFFSFSSFFFSSLLLLLLLPPHSIPFSHFLPPFWKKMKVASVSWTASNVAGFVDIFEDVKLKPTSASKTPSSDGENTGRTFSLVWSDRLWWIAWATYVARAVDQDTYE